MVLDSIAIRWTHCFSLTMMVVLLTVCFGSQVPAQDPEPASNEIGESESKKVEAETSIFLENALLKPYESTKVSSEVEGRIAQLKVREGDWVSQDQVIGNMEDRTVRLQLERSKIATSMAQLKFASQVEIKLAKGKAEVAKNELDRAVVANSKVSDTYPLKEIDRLKLVYDSAILEVDRAVEDKSLQELELKKTENEQAVIEDQLTKHQLKSPVTGMVVSMSKHSSEWVQPGTEILQIVRLDRLKIEGFVKAGQLDKLNSRKALATVQQENKEIRVSGKVFFVFPEVNPLTKQMRVQLEVENPGGQLVPGSPVRAAILPN